MKATYLIAFLLAGCAPQPVEEKAEKALLAYMDSTFPNAESIKTVRMTSHQVGHKDSIETEITRVYQYQDSTSAVKIDSVHCIVNASGKVFFIVPTY